MNNESPSLMTLTEAAHLLKVSKNTIYYWVHRREIPFLKVGKHLRFQPRELLRHFASRAENQVPCHLMGLTIQNSSHGSLTIGRADIADSQKE
jgi:excisionase family DNA binding protein